MAAAQPQEHWQGEEVVFDLDCTAVLNGGETAGTIALRFDLYRRGNSTPVITKTQGAGIAGTSGTNARVTLTGAGGSRDLAAGAYEWTAWRTDTPNILK